MNTETLDLFASTLQDIAASRQLMTDHQGLTKALLVRLSEKGVTLKQCAGPLMMDRPMPLLKSYCTKFGIRFPDFTPANMRTQLKFIRAGDFMELTGDFVAPVAAALGIVVTNRNGADQCGVPIHAWEDAKKKLRDAGFEARRGAAPKKTKVAAHA